jgi:hypothetical protein
MSYLLPVSSTTTTKLKNFNGLRRTVDGMLYLTTIDREKSTEEITVSKYYEEGKSDLVPKDETNYVDERDEYYDVQNFTVAGSNTFTLVSAIDNANMITVFVNNIKKIPFSDFNVSSNILTLTITPANGIIVNVCMNKKRYFNNDSDKFQQFTYDFKSTYLINSDGELVRRENKPVARTALVSDDFDTFENTAASVNSTTYVGI